MMNRSGVRGSPWRTPALSFKCVGVFIHYLYGFDYLLWDAIHMKNPEQFDSVY